MKEKKKQNQVNEPQSAYTRLFKIFNSFEEQQEDEIKEMAKLTGEEILKQMRQMINVAYGMHGYDPLNLPKKHDIVIIQPEQ